MSITITPLVCGAIEADAGGFFAGEAGTIRLPVYSFLIRHPQGNVLFDTGMHTDLQTSKERLGPLGPLFQLDYSAGDELAARLGTADSGPDDVDVVFNSHLHFDHAGGNEQIPDARVVVQRREWEAGGDPQTRSGGYQPADYDLGHDVVQVDGEHDLFGDGRLVAVPTYGHTAGHQSLLVRSDDRGEVLLTGDSCYLRRALEESRVPVFGFDLDEQRRSYDILRRLEAAGATLVFGHDADLPAVFTASP